MLSRLPFLIASLLALLSPLTASPISWSSPSCLEPHLGCLIKGKPVLLWPGQAPDTGSQCFAAIHVAASKKEIWDVIIDPVSAPKYLPNLKESRLISSSPNTQLVAQTVKVGFLPLTLSYRYLADHTPFQQIQFSVVDGDLRHFEGSWQLIDASSLGMQGGTVIFYQVFLDMGDLIPRALVRRNLSRDVPEMLQLVRTQIYRLQGA